MAGKFNSQVEKAIAKVDDWMGVSSNEKNPWVPRAFFTTLIAIPVAIVIFNIWSFAKYAPKNEQKKIDGIEKPKSAPEKKNWKGDDGRTIYYTPMNVSMSTDRKMEGMAFGARIAKERAGAKQAGGIAAAKTNAMRRICY